MKLIWMMKLNTTGDSFLKIDNEGYVDILIFSMSTIKNKKKLSLDDQYDLSQ